MTNKKIQKFRIYDYQCDGNKKEGFEVNDAYRTIFTVDLKKEYRESVIIQKLKEVGFLKKSCKNSKFKIEGEFDYCLYINYNGSYFMPFCELRPIKE